MSIENVVAWWGINDKKVSEGERLENGNLRRPKRKSP
jgi:hypothetical protein